MNKPTNATKKGFKHLRSKPQNGLNDKKNRIINDDYAAAEK